MIKNLHKKKYKNIFETISKKVDPISYNNNKKATNLCFYEKNNDNNIEKLFINENMFRWEIDVYLYLIDKNIVPLSSTGKQKLIYSTSDKIPLYTFLKKKDTNIKYILNNLFSFVYKFKKINFIHGNLHLYNIFLDENEMFNVIDFSYSHFKNSSNIDCLYKNPYLIDLYLIYIELYDFYKNNKIIILYLQDLLLNYIDLNDLKQITDDMNKTQLLN